MREKTVKLFTAMVVVGLALILGAVAVSASRSVYDDGAKVSTAFVK